VEDTTVKLPPGEFGEETFDGIEPRTGCRGEVENKPLVAIEPGPDLWMLRPGPLDAQARTFGCSGPDLWMLMGGVVVENDMDGLVFGEKGIVRRALRSPALEYTNEVDFGFKNR
jgi:hypothetical protein